MVKITVADLGNIPRTKGSVHSFIFGIENKG